MSEADSSNSKRRQRHAGCRHQQPPAVMLGVELDLVHNRRSGSGRKHGLELGGAEVRDADRPGQPELESALEAVPGFGCATLRPVHQVKVELVHAQAAQAHLGGSDRVSAARQAFGRDEYLFPGHAAVAERAADALLVPVCLRCVDVAVSGLERPADGVYALTAVWDLPDSEAEHGHLVPVRKHARIRGRR